VCCWLDGTWGAWLLSLENGGGNSIRMVGVLIRSREKEKSGRKSL